MPFGDILERVANGTATPEEVAQLRIMGNALNNLIGLAAYVNPITGEITNLRAGPSTLTRDGIILEDADGGGRRPEITFRAGAGTPMGRLAGYSTASGEAGAYLLTNAYYDGTNWNADDTTQAGTIFQGSANAAPAATAFQWRTVPEGGKPATPANLLLLTHQGLLPLVSSAVTMASNAITAKSSYMVVDTSGGASEDLNTISLGTGAPTAVGGILVIRAANSARSVVLKDGVDNLKLAGDCTLDNVEDTIVLIGDADGTYWTELCRSNNGA